MTLHRTPIWAAHEAARQDWEAALGVRDGADLDRTRLSARPSRAVMPAVGGRAAAPATDTQRRSRTGLLQPFILDGFARTEG